MWRAAYSETLGLKPKQKKPRAKWRQKQIVWWWQQLSMYSVGGLESDLHYYIGAFTAVRTVKAVAPPEDNYAELSDI